MMKSFPQSGGQSHRENERINTPQNPQTSKTLNKPTNIGTLNNGAFNKPSLKKPTLNKPQSHHEGQNSSNKPQLTTLKPNIQQGDAQEIKRELNTFKVGGQAVLGRQAL